MSPLLALANQLDQYSLAFRAARACRGSALVELIRCAAIERSIWALGWRWHESPRSAGSEKARELIAIPRTVQTLIDFKRKTKQPLWHCLRMRRNSLAESRLTHCAQARGESEGERDSGMNGVNAEQSDRAAKCHAKVMLIFSSHFAVGAFTTKDGKATRADDHNWFSLDGCDE